MMNLADNEHCTGCTACIAVCPKNCITMESDAEGFQYPIVDGNGCINCGRCEKVCPALHPIAQTGNDCDAYGIRARDTGLRLKSSSGGVFTLLADKVLEQDGAVVGAAMSPDCKTAHHVLVTDFDGLASLQGSKYLQSDLGDIFRQVRSELENGRSVLFTGTPCQVDGLKNFLGKDYDALLCMEVICHGVPSPDLWKKYMEYIREKSGAPVEKADFRHKKYGWTLFGLRLENSNRRVLYSTLQNDPYMRMFLQDQCLRPSCYQCPSKGLARKADLTVGDFWGIQNVAPELDDDKGTSLVLVHTEKGKRALQAILNETEYQEVDCMAALQGNPAMLRSVPKPVERNRFFSDMAAMGFDELQRKYVSQTSKDRIKSFLQKSGMLPLAYRMVHILRK